MIFYIMAKKKKKKKVKKEIIFRNKEQRKEEVSNVIKQLNEFELNITYKPIQELFKLFKHYIESGEEVKVNIPFPEINRRIKGILSISVNQDVTVALLNEKF